MLNFVFELFSHFNQFDAHYVIANEAPDDPRIIWRFVCNNIMGVELVEMREQLKNKI